MTKNLSQFHAYFILIKHCIMFLCVILGRISSLPDKGIPDMTCISDIDEQGINRNLKVRYQRDEVYVSFFKTTLFLL